MNLPGPLPFQCVWHCVLFLSQAAVIQRSGHRDVLGHTPKGYWETMELNCGRPKPPSLQTLPLHLYGDECQAWQGTQLMCFHWMSEVSPLQKDAAKSRFLIACIPTSYYWKEGRCNQTVQELLKQIVLSFNTFALHGVDGLFGEVTTLKGDIKFMTQSLNLARHPGRNEVCWRCLATKDLSKPYTDISAGARWRVWTLLPHHGTQVRFQVSLTFTTLVYCLLWAWTSYTYGI